MSTAMRTRLKTEYTVASHPVTLNGVLDNRSQPFTLGGDQPLHFTAARAFQGNPEAMWRFAETLLAAIGFRITNRTPDAMHFEGPGMHSSRQNPLLGATRIHLRCSGRELELDADLGGVQRLARFVVWFPVLLPLALGVLFFAVFSAQFGPGPWMWGVGLATGGNAALWFVLGPWMAHRLRIRTLQALEILLDNLTAPHVT